MTYDKYDKEYSEYGLPLFYFTKKYNIDIKCRICNLRTGLPAAGWPVLRCKNMQNIPENIKYVQYAES